MTTTSLIITTLARMGPITTMTNRVGIFFSGRSDTT